VSAAGVGDAVPVRDAATVVLLRDGAAGLETWLLTRVSQMTFAAGMSVFPGGRVEDADAQLPFAGPASGLAGRFDCPETLARALLGAAVRETFEETGVLLTVPSVDLAHRRAAIEAGEVPFGRLLREHGLLVDPDALRPWGRWVTPAGETRRYDTRFFVAALPSGARAADVTSESSAASWVGVVEALAQARRGDRMLLPPTAVTLASLAPFSSVAAVLAASAQRDLAAVRPRFRRLDDGSLAVALPDGTTVAVPRQVHQ
jgi:8-oxo-dGTP pyrophosphatase MutT (NUDIX family)